MKILEGSPASLGIGIGKVVFIDTTHFHISEHLLSDSEVQEEIDRFSEALETAKQKLHQAREKSSILPTKEIQDIYHAHSQFFEDPVIMEKIILQIREQKKNAELAVQSVFEEQKKLFSRIDERYSLDLKDVRQRILTELTSHIVSSIDNLTSDSVIVARELYPSQTADLFTHRVAGLVTEVGGHTSHTAIIARSLEIPCVVGLGDVQGQVEPGQEIIVDGFTGKVIFEPTSKVIEQYHKKRVHFIKTEEKLIQCSLEESKTKDGKYVQVSANMELPNEIVQAKKYCAEGVGLFRTEFLFVQQSIVTSSTEDEQYDIYKRVVSDLGAKSPQHNAGMNNYVIFRTIDMGGDKFIFTDQHFRDEPNPFLGTRAIRLCLSDEGRKFFKTQLRALLRAAVHGNLWIMVPFISTVEEMWEVKRIFKECCKELEERNLPYDAHVPLGSMIELPSSAVIADVLIKEVDFFSIGTNDLIQYTLAVDRKNENVNYLYDPLNLAVLRLIQQTIQAAKKEKKWIGVCGEMASSPITSLILIGMGVDELSVTPMYVPIIKATMRNIHYEKVRKVVREKIMVCHSREEIYEAVRHHIIPMIPDLIQKEFFSEWEMKLLSESI